jgi:protein FrlC
MTCPRLLVTAGFGTLDEPRGGAWERARDSLATLARRAEREGLDLALEPLTVTESNLVTTTADLRRMMAEIGSPAISGVLDTNAMAVAGESVTDYAAVPRGLSHVHLVDGLPDGHLAWGDGNLPLEQYLRDLGKADYSGPLTFEFTAPRYWLEPFVALQRSVEACVRLLDPGS